MDVAITKSRTQGIAAVGVIHCGHVGRLGEYAEKAAEAGTIAILGASGGPCGGLVAPFGGAQQVVSTNPIAAGVPAGKRPTFVMDFATSVVAAGKLELAPDKDRESQRDGQSIPRDDPPGRRELSWRAVRCFPSAGTKDTESASWWSFFAEG